MPSVVERLDALEAAVAALEAAVAALEASVAQIDSRCRQRTAAGEWRVED